MQMQCELCHRPGVTKIVDEILLVICTHEKCRHVYASADPKQIAVARSMFPTQDELAQDAEVADDCAGAIAALHDQVDEREEALQTVADLFFTESDLHGPGELCNRCSKAALDQCGPEVKDSEPCDAFANAEERYKKLANVRKILEPS